jgi:hypothetical protein
MIQTSAFVLPAGRPNHYGDSLSPYLYDHLPTLRFWEPMPTVLCHAMAGSRPFPHATIPRFFVFTWVVSSHGPVALLQRGLIFSFPRGLSGRGVEGGKVIHLSILFSALFLNENETYFLSIPWLTFVSQKPSILI